MNTKESQNINDSIPTPTVAVASKNTKRTKVYKVLALQAALGYEPVSEF
jgi:hypothetical protein